MSRSDPEDAEEAVRKVNAIILSVPERVDLPAGCDIYGGKRLSDDALARAGFEDDDARELRSYLRESLRDRKARDEVVKRLGELRDSVRTFDQGRTSSLLGWFQSNAPPIYSALSKIDGIRNR